MTKKHPYRSQFPGVGPKTVEDLDYMGIQTREELEALGAEGAMELFLRVHGGWKSGMCSCVAYGFEGIITRTMRYKIPAARKKQLVAATHALRKQFAKS